MAIGLRLLCHTCKGAEIICLSAETRGCDLQISRPAWTEVPEIRRMLQDAECVGERREVSRLAKMRETRTSSPCTALAMAVRTGNRAAVEMIGKSVELNGLER